MKRKIVFFALLIAMLVLALPACGGRAEQFADRGRYIYDEAGRLPQESEISLAYYFWQLDSKTDYELVLVFPKEKLEESAIIQWFNDHGVGKKKVDNGAAIFVFPDNSVFVSIGSGNDKVSVAYSKTHGERILANLEEDPVLTLLRFVNSLGGKIDEPTSFGVGERFFESLKDNLNVILLWAAVIALFFFLVQQFNGFQPRDLILPFATFAALGIFFGFSALGSGSSKGNYETYGVITSTKLGSYPWTHLHQQCTTIGKTTTCYTIPHGHTMYTNDVQLRSYELKDYGYRFKSDENKAAWQRQAGELYALTVHVETGALQGASGISDNSGGQTIGDGVWINASKKKSKGK